MFCTFIDRIIKGDFFEANEIYKQLGLKKEVVYEKLLEYTYDTETIAVYAYYVYNLQQEETAELHNIISTLLAMPLCYLKNAHDIALYHAKKSIALEPTNMYYKEYILFFYNNQNVIKSLSKEEAIEYSKEIIKSNPNNCVANEILRECNLL